MIPNSQDSNFTNNQQNYKRWTKNSLMLIFQSSESKKNSLRLTIVLVPFIVIAPLWKWMGVIQGEFEL
jgi:hypothetical protein